MPFDPSLKKKKKKKKTGFDPDAVESGDAPVEAPAEPAKEETAEVEQAPEKPVDDGK